MSFPILVASLIIMTLFEISDRERLELVDKRRNSLWLQIMVAGLCHCMFRLFALRYGATKKQKKKKKNATRKDEITKKTPHEKTK